MENNDLLIFKVTNNKKPIIFSDVDGTLYNDFNILDETKKDISFAQKNMADFNICTGNPVFERMLNVSNEVNANYLIASSGSQIYDLKQNKIIKTWPMSFENLKKILDFIKNEDVQMLFWDNENYYFTNENYYRNNEIILHHFLNIDSINKNAKKYNNEEIMPLKIEIYGQKDLLKRKEVNERLLVKLKTLDNISIFSVCSHLEILFKNITKASAISWMANNIYSCSINDVMAIGDVDMLKLVGFSYAMANANQEVLKIAKFFTSAVEQNGLGEAIIDYLYRLKNITRKYMLHNFNEKD
ncbi:haloacid dehalogenase [Metamycoplasma salivarium]|nr:HAD hydrolase family protein [Metamycoplasma salivarium]GIZ05905.1 haloacid dehalogenase [Metamycoplasma salivarium]